VLRLAKRKTGASVHLCNAYTLSLADRDPEYLRRLNRGDLNLPDGVPVAVVGRLRGSAISGPVRGKDLFESVLDSGRPTGTRHVLYGSTPSVVETAARALADKYPGVQIVAAEAPPFRPLTDEERERLVARLHMWAAEVVWVGLGTPKQDEFAEDMKQRYGAAFVAVGAAFDFVAGSKKEAPRWLRGTGLEWVHRLMSEPRRLWRRYLIGNAVFLRGVARDSRRRT
jgi:N-acetylglucosaminyldiphosphoundecaprenol N-acetyl-beta-D-mannosaminyltransferase